MELLLQYKSTVDMTTKVSIASVCINTYGCCSPTLHHESVTYRLGLKLNRTGSNNVQPLFY